MNWFAKRDERIAELEGKLNSLALKVAVLERKDDVVVFGGEHFPGLGWLGRKTIPCAEAILKLAEACGVKFEYHVGHTEYVKAVKRKGKSHD